MKRVTVLGSTGSIGTQALEVIEAHPDRFQVAGLTAQRSWERLAEQARRVRPARVALADTSRLPRLQEALRGSGVEVLGGEEGVLEVASAPADVALSALVGVAGLRPTLAALEADIPIALANKETLVVGGELVTGLARRRGLPLLPVDSEHSAILQCLQGEDRGALRKIILTASGGPFRGASTEALASVTSAQALRHPNWEMGAKITIDSATLMNKGFEVLEAVHLFDLELDQVEVWVHPQSVVHSMCEFVDGSVIAQLGPPDMRLPIQLALGWPERLPRRWSSLDLRACRELTFEPPRLEDFRCLGLAYEAGRRGGTLPAVLNGANEVAVARFLAGEIGFLDIPRILEGCMGRHRVVGSPSLADLERADREARSGAAAWAPSGG